MDFSLWAFEAPLESVDQWCSAVIQLQSRETVQCPQVLASREYCRIDLKAKMGFASVGCVDYESQLWVLETAGPFSSVFHWMLRYYGARCIPRSPPSGTCKRSFFATEERVQERPHDLQASRMMTSIASPSGDLAIIRSPDDSSETEISQIDYAVRVRECLLRFRSADQLREPARSSVKHLARCTACQGKLGFDEIWRLRQ